MAKQHAIISCDAAAANSTGSTVQTVEVERSPSGAQELILDVEIVIGGERIRVGGVRVEVPDDQATPSGGTRETPIPGIRVETLPGSGEQEN